MRKAGKQEEPQKANIRLVSSVVTADIHAIIPDDDLNLVPRRQTAFREFDNESFLTR